MFPVITLLVNFSDPIGFFGMAKMDFVAIIEKLLLIIVFTGTPANKIPLVFINALANIIIQLFFLYKNKGKERIVSN